MLSCAPAVVAPGPVGACSAPGATAPVLGKRKRRPPSLSVKVGPLAPQPAESQIPSVVATPVDLLGDALDSWGSEGRSLSSTLSYGVSAKRGGRGVRLNSKRHIEDRFTALVDMSNTAHHGTTGNNEFADVSAGQGISFFAVYDGHGGSQAADFCANRLHTVLLQDENFGIDMPAALTSAFLSTDEAFLAYRERAASLLCQPTTQPHAATGPLTGANNGFISGTTGTTAVCAVVEGDTLWVANAGDSRCVASRGGCAVALSHDHKASCEDERARIEAQGGGVFIQGGLHRVQGVLAVSRAIGDADLKPYVDATPDIVCHR